jgi:hypothetical protein
MNQPARLIVKDSPKTTSGMASAPITPQAPHILSKPEKGSYRCVKEAGLVLRAKYGDKPATTVELEREEDIIAEFLIPTFLFLGCPALPARSS